MISDNGYLWCLLKKINCAYMKETGPSIRRIWKLVQIEYSSSVEPCVLCSNLCTLEWKACETVLSKINLDRRPAKALPRPSGDTERCFNTAFTILAGSSLGIDHVIGLPEPRFPHVLICICLTSALVVLDGTVVTTRSKSTVPPPNRLSPPAFRVIAPMRPYTC